MNIVLIGFTFSGKSTVGKLLAEKLGYHFIDTDRLTESLFTQAHGVSKCVSDIYRNFGQATMRDFETQAVSSLQGINNTIIATGGGTLLQQNNTGVLKSLGTHVYLHMEFSTAQERMEKGQIPSYLNKKNPLEDFKERYTQRLVLYENNAHIKIMTSRKPPIEITQMILDQLEKRYVRTQY